MICRLCPKECGVNRKEKLGLCRASEEMKISWYGFHPGEEPPISGSKGSGTIFFCHCNLKCVFCQNWQISQEGANCQKVSGERLVEIFFELQNKGRHNINLVTPTIWTLSRKAGSGSDGQLIKAIRKAKKKGLKIPIVWNSNAYEKVETLKMLDGLVDIYLPDYKYSDDHIAIKYSSAPKYPEIARRAVLEMQRQVGDLVLGKEGIAKKGLIVRHLVLPNHLENTYKCLEFIRSLSDNVNLSLMSQYNPQYKADQFPEINRFLDQKEFESVSKMVEELNFQYGWIQEFGGAVKCLNPDFNKRNPFK